MLASKNYMNDFFFDSLANSLSVTSTRSTSANASYPRAANNPEILELYGSSPTTNPYKYWII